MGALHSAVRAGKALYVGISSYSPEDTARAAEVLADLGTPLLIHQPSYSMLNRWIETEGLLDTLEDVGAGCIDRKSTRLNSSHANISYAVFCLKKKKSIS